MIKKSYELNSNILKKHNFILIHGKNEGLKNEKISELSGGIDNTNIFKYDENEILNNEEIFFNQVLNKSLFDNEKFIIINRITGKIFNTIEKILEKKIDDKIILNANILDKKSKLRNLFEKSKDYIAVTAYEDSNETLIKIVNDFFKKNKINISQSDKNIIINKCNNDRGILKDELNKIEIYCLNKKKIDFDEIIKITNLNENFSTAELVDNCLAGNKKKMLNILNENNYEPSDSIIILRTILIKTKKILQLYDNYKITKNLDETINNFKPPIFWKDKEITKQQLKNWEPGTLKNTIIKISELEKEIKKNLNISGNIIRNFMIELSS